MRIYRYVDATYHLKGEEGSFMTGREHMPAATREGGVLRREHSQVLRLFALGFAIVAALAITLGATLSAAQAAGLFKFTQYKVPTANSAPSHITAGSDENLWFTESNPEFNEETFTEIGKVAQITPAGDITEFAVCEFCSPNDIVQGPGSVLYFTTNDPGLGRITTAGEVQGDVVPRNGLGDPIFSANGNGIARHDNDVWYADFNNDTIYRYNTVSEEFTRFKVPNTPTDVAVDANGIVWYTANSPNAIGRLDPNSGTVVGNDPVTGEPTANTGSVVGATTETPVPAMPNKLAISTDGKVWYTERIADHIGRLDPSNSQLTRFPTLTPDAGPQDITAARDGSLWFTQANAGNAAQITADGTITEADKASKASAGTLENALGITMGPDGRSVWFAKPADNMIARLTPR